MSRQPFSFSEQWLPAASAPTPARRSEFAPIGGTVFTGIGYDATQHTGKRKQPHSRTMSEDLELRDMARRLLTANARDLVRNFAIVGFMVRAHLDSISSFRFRAKTSDQGLNRDVNQFMEDWSRPENCDAAGRHSLRELNRLHAAHATIDGDVLVNRIKTGKLQTIEGDRIQTFGGIPFKELGIDDPSWVINGVWCNPYGKAQGYMVFKRPPQWGALQWDRMIPARYADLLGYYMRADQIRGISPLASCANVFRDVYEGFDYAVMKAKISQYFAVQVIRQSADAFGLNEVREGETEPQGDPNKPRYDVNLGRGPVFQEMDPGDKMEIVESQTPSQQFQGFMQMMILVGLKSLDLPFSFFDESHTNYSGSRLAGIRYETSCEHKRERQRTVLHRTTRWRLGLAIADGEIRLPAKMQPQDLRWEWSHTGMPLFDPQKEITADIMAVNAGFASPQEVCRARGKDFESVIDEIAAAQAYAKTKGVSLTTTLAAATADQKAETDQSAQQIEEDKQREANFSRMWNW